MDIVNPNLDLERYRRHIGWLEQEVTIVEGSVYQSVGYGLDHLHKVRKEQMVRAALNMVGLPFYEEEHQPMEV